MENKHRKRRGYDDDEVHDEEVDKMIKRLHRIIAEDKIMIQNLTKMVDNLKTKTRTVESSATSLIANGEILHNSLSHSNEQQSKEDFFKEEELAKYGGLLNESEIKASEIENVSPEHSRQRTGEILKEKIDDLENPDGDQKNEEVKLSSPLAEAKSQQRLLVDEILKSMINNPLLSKDDILNFLSNPHQYTKSAVSQIESSDDSENTVKLTKAEKNCFALYDILINDVRKKIGNDETIDEQEMNSLFANFYCRAEEQVDQEIASLENCNIGKYEKMLRKIEIKMEASGLPDENIKKYFKELRESQQKENSDKLKKLRIEGGNIFGIYLKMIEKLKDSMKLDGIDSIRIENYFSHLPMKCNSGTIEVSNITTHLHLPMNDKFKKFAVMRKSMVPEMAVRQKMMLEKFTAEEIDIFFNGDSEDLIKPLQNEKNGGSIEVKEENISSWSTKYDKQLEMVVKKMTNDGLTKEEVENFFLEARKMMLNIEIYHTTIEDTKQSMRNDGLPESDIIKYFQSIPTFGPVNNSSNSKEKLSSNSSVAMTETSISTAAAITDFPDKFKKFAIMRKSKVPEMAIRQKMTLEKFTADEIDAFFDNAEDIAAGSGEISSTSTSTSISSMKKYEDKINTVHNSLVDIGFTMGDLKLFYNTVRKRAELFSIYDNKIDDIKNMMKNDRIDMTTIQEYFIKAEPNESETKNNTLKSTAMTREGTTMTISSTSAATAAAITDFPDKFKKFAIMRKSKVPEMAIRQKMTLEKFTADEIDAFFDNAEDIAAGSGEISSTTIVAEATAIGIKSGQSSMLAKYDNLLNKLISEIHLDNRLDSKDIHAFFLNVNNRAAKLLRFYQGEEKTRKDNVADKTGETFSEEKPKALKKEEDIEIVPAGLSAKIQKQPKVALNKLFWRKIKTKDVKKTIFSDVHNIGLDNTDYELIETHFFNTKVVKEIENNEAKGEKEKVNVTNASIAASKNQINKQRKSLLDSKKNQNLLILLKKLRCTPGEIVAIISDADPNKLTLDLAELLNTAAFLPTAEEFTTCSNYSGDWADLDETSKLYAMMKPIVRLEQRLKVQIITFSWSNALTKVLSKINALSKACDEVEEDLEDFKILLAVILAVGNYMNHGNKSYGNAFGFQLSSTLNSLKNIKHSKPTDEKLKPLTFFQCLALIIEKKAPNVLKWSKNWEKVHFCGALKIRK